MSRKVRYLPGIFSSAFCWTGVKGKAFIGGTGASLPEGSVFGFAGGLISVSG